MITITKAIIVLPYNKPQEIIKKQLPKNQRSTWKPKHRHAHRTIFNNNYYYNNNNNNSKIKPSNLPCT